MIGRRRFLLAAGASAGLMALGPMLWRKTSLRRFERTAAALGTKTSITVLHSDKKVAHAALDAAFAEIETVEVVMSIYRESSQLRRLNRDGVLDHPHPYFVDVLSHAAATSRATDGAFDVTVQPLWALYARAIKRDELPSDQAIAQSLQLVDWRKVEVRPERIQLNKVGMQITLNGIAQGFAADRALAVLKSHGIEHALVDAGELAPLGSNEKSPWRVGIQHPRVNDAYVALANLDQRCLATSGDYETRLSAEVHHIFDPRSGRSPQQLASVTIAAPSGMTADALSTACFVLGPERAAEVIEQMDGVDAFFVLTSGRVLKTTHFPIGA
jgi:thiamine biosynthesis lipoprotein